MYDFIVVGQGLAGSVLSYTLLKNQYKVLVVDEPKTHSSSKVAAGLFNPITGRKMTKTWLADTLFPFLKQFYTQLEKDLGSQFFYPTNIYFPFDSQEKQNDWLAYSSEAKYQNYIVNFHFPSLYTNHIHADFGGMEIQRSGYLDIPNFLNSYADFLRKENILIQEKIEFEDLDIGSGQGKWKNKVFKKMIFCDGAGNLENPFFDWLEFRPVKGELFSLKVEKKFNHIINRNGWLIPWHDGSFKSGATYENQDLTKEITVKGKNQLEEKLTNLLKIPFEVLEQKAGIRPATYDRRPFVGLHPEIEILGVFNGMGAKGVSLTPYLAQHFSEFLEGNNPLMPEIRPERSLAYRKKKQMKGE